jgi:hypothetical protein
MTQISRPFQIALIAIVLLGGVWFFALRGHSASTGGSGSPSSSAPAQSPTPGTSAAAQAKGAGAATPVYHGPAPGVEGLTRAIARAHEAVATSQQDAKRSEQQSAGASSPSSTAAAPTVPSTAPSPTRSASKGSTTLHGTGTSGSTRAHKVSRTAAGTITGPDRVPARQVLVEQELKQGAVVAVLFWNPKSVVDVAVHDELQLLLAVHHGLRSARNKPQLRRLLKAVDLELSSKIAVQEAPASQVASFGSFTHSVQVYQTPTMLIINPHGQTATLTGLVDAFAIEQAIDEARHS